MGLLLLSITTDTTPPDNYSGDFYNFSLGGDNETISNDSMGGMPESGMGDKEYIFDRLLVRTIFIVVYTIVFCSCFFGNLLVILVVTLHWRMRSITNFCLANLAFANLCVGVFCVYQNLSTYLIISWVFGDFMCKMYHFINSLSYTASILILVVICIERYLAIIHPIRSRQILTINRLRASIVAVWIISAIYCSPRLYYIATITMTHHDGSIETLCIAKQTLYNSASFDVINFLLMFLVPLLVISVLYAMIGVTLWKSSHNQMAAPSSASSDSLSLERDPSNYLQNGHARRSNIHRTRRISSLQQESQANMKECGGKKEQLPKKATSTCFFFCLERKRKEPEWSLYRNSSSKVNNSKSRPSLVLTDPEDVDHILQDNDEGLLRGSGGKLNGIPSISLAVDSQLSKPIGNGFVENTKRKLTLSEVRHQRQINLMKQEKIDELPLKPKLMKEDSSDSMINFRNGKNRTCEQRRNIFKFGSRVTAFSQSKEKAKYTLNTDAGRKANGILKSHSSKYLERDIETGSLQSSPSRDNPPALKRVGAMKANRIGVQALKSRRRVVRMLIVIVATFAICNAPFHGRKLWQIWGSSYRGWSVFSALFTPITFLAMYANCAINPILYAFMSANFRQSFRDVLSCRLRQQLDKNHRRRNRNEMIATSNTFGSS